MRTIRVKDMGVLLILHKKVVCGHRIRLKEIVPIYCLKYYIALLCVQVHPQDGVDIGLSVSVYQHQTHFVTRMQTGVM